MESIKHRLTLYRKIIYFRIKILIISRSGCPAEHPRTACFLIAPSDTAGKKAYFLLSCKAFAKARSVLNASPCLNGSLKATHFFSRRHRDTRFFSAPQYQAKEIPGTYILYIIPREHPEITTSLSLVLACIFSKPEKTVTK